MRVSYTIQNPSSGKNILSDLIEGKNKEAGRLYAELLSLADDI